MEEDGLLMLEEDGGEICRVCEANKAGRHYGSVCCEGCKDFFRRSVRFQKVYSCSREQKCAIRKAYRNCCRFCRFQKCLRVGLDPMLVILDRAAKMPAGPSIKPAEWKGERASMRIHGCGPTKKMAQNNEEGEEILLPDILT